LRIKNLCEIAIHAYNLEPTTTTYNHAYKNDVSKVGVFA
jgi:hypothetical protein